MLYGFTQCKRCESALGENAQILKKGHEIASALYLKFGEAFVAIMSMSLVNSQLAVLNPGRLVDSGCIAELCLILCS